MRWSEILSTSVIERGSLAHRVMVVSTSEKRGGDRFSFPAEERERLSALAASTTARAAAAGPRDELWKQVEDAVKKGQPKTAIDKLEPIIEQALADEAYAEAIKAIGQKIALEGNIQGNKPEEKITRMRGAIDKSPAEMQPVMEAILANWYWHYFQQNRWRFVQRSQTAAPPGEDFTTWDLARILSEIDKQFQKALASADAPLRRAARRRGDGQAATARRPLLRATGRRGGPERRIICGHRAGRRC